MTLLPEDLGQIIPLVTATILSATLIGLYKYFKNRLHCIDIVAESVKKVDERSLRQSKGLILLAQRLEEEYGRVHPEQTPKYSQEMRTALEDNEGNL